MDSCKYLVAFALIEQGEERAMPIGGKSIKQPLKPDQTPEEIGTSIVNQLLLRVFQRSQKEPLRRAADDFSLLIAELSIDVMQERIPLLKSRWINMGETQLLINELVKISEIVWAVSFSRDDGVVYSKIG